MSRTWAMLFATFLGSPAVAQEPTLLRARAVNELPSAPADHRLSYGPDSLQFGDLRLPPGAGPHPVAVVVHGGCFIGPFATLQNTAALTDTLRRIGIATWNIEYRRLDHPGGGWPGTLEDVANATDFVRTIAPQFGLDTARVIAVGHSAGGMLVGWLGARSTLPPTHPLSSATATRLQGLVYLAGTPDLAGFAPVEMRVCGQPVVARLLGDSSSINEARLREVSAAERLPLRIPQRLIMGDQDHAEPDGLSAAYVERATGQGDDATLVVAPDAGHFEVIAPVSATWAFVERAILELLRMPPRQ